MPAHRKTNFLASARLKAHARGLPLPRRRWTLRIRHIASAGRAQFFAYERLLASQLGHHRIQFLAIIRESAIGHIITIPASRRVKRIEVWQADWRYMST